MHLDIMMPFYGRVDHFREAVESVLAQTDPDWRLVVIDDHYPDPTAGDWVVALGDQRIEYVRHPANVGINRNFRESVERSRAELVVVFGCDDRMHPGYVARMKQLAAEYPDATMLHPGVRIIDEDGTPVRTLVDTAKAYYRPRANRPVRLSGESEIWRAENFRCWLAVCKGPMIAEHDRATEAQLRCPKGAEDRR